MKRIKNIFLLLAGASFVLSCNKQITEKQPDPNNAQQVPPNLILGTVLYEMSGEGGASSVGALGGINSWDLVPAWNQYHCQNYDYYGDNRYTWTNGSSGSDNASNTSSGPFNSYLVLKNVLQMEQEANRLAYPAVNPYEAIGRFVRAYYYYNMTMLMGDVPLDSALQELSNLKPAYTSQEKVFEYVLNELDTANSDFASLQATNNATLSASQDIYFAGSLLKWQQLVNSFQLRVLVQLSPKVADANLSVPTRFNRIVSDPATYPIFTSQADDLEFVYNPGGLNQYSLNPFNNSNYGSVAGRFNMAATYVSTLTGMQDPRVFATCEPAWALVTDSAHLANFSYYVGASTGEAVGSMYNEAGAGVYSFINRHRYYLNYTGDPDVLVGFKELQFNIAEGILRGWTGGNAETYYKAGIAASMSFYGIDVTTTSQTAYLMPKAATNATQAKAFPYTFDYNAWYATDSIKLNADPAKAINQIVKQKYVAMFENSGYEAYYNWRRTGVPAFQNGTGVGNGGIVPLRWAYPTTEQVQNATNYSAALSAQGFSADDLNQKIWLIK